MSVIKRDFGVTKAGRAAHLYTIANKNGMAASVTDYGAILVSLLVPDGNGAARDVVLGYDSLLEYEKDGFFGATVGRNANRIAGAAFTLDGVEYHLAGNDGGNNLHTDFEKGFHKMMWDGEILPDGVKLSRVSPDGEGGFPGTLRVSVTYTLLPDNALRITYDAVSDKKTLINLTNHSFFNLGGHDAGSICDEKLTLYAGQFVEIGEGLIPTGRLLPVEGTPMDFRWPKRIGNEIDRDWGQLALAQGYDHTWVADTKPGILRKIAVVEDNASECVMEVYTDLPGVQFYTANFLEPQIGKNGAHYDKRCALCLETQYFPDSIHHPSFPQPVFDAGRPYHATTIYQFPAGKSGS